MTSNDIQGLMCVGTFCAVILIVVVVFLIDELRG